MTGRRLLYLLPLVGFLALAAYFLRGLAPGYDPQVLPSALIDKPAPNFTLAGFKGGAPLSNADFAGELVLVNFFASWCVPCRAESPVLMDLARRNVVQLYGIDYKDKPEDAAKFLQTFGDPYRRIGVDETGRTAINFGVYGVPETYAIDRAGRIRWRHVGPLSEQVVRTEIMPLLKQLGAS
ncbi:MAG: DsbE family thiol:disulfide interchange protein [Alphaproteobacteria bacterium]|nr:DsbE family thiol:disulfide interchange protein [Alphaproteobacteria bacterium]